MTQCVLATGFIADDASQGSVFPSAGGNSGSAQVQAIYWRCLVVLFASARIWNPHLRLMLFTNITPPVVDGIALADVLAKLNVECRIKPLTVRLAQSRTPTWGNVLYFFDILDDMCSESEDLRFVLVDSDVVVNGDLQPVFELLAKHDFLAIDIVETAPDEDINDMSPREMAAAAREIQPSLNAQVVKHIGGEFLGLTPASWRRHRSLFVELLDRSLANLGIAGKARTEEHLWSIAFATLPAGAVGEIAPYLKRLWTHPRVNNVKPGDEALLLWHMPYEKRYGLPDLFSDLAKRGFPPTMDPQEFSALARERCGLPRKSVAKLLRDGVRQVSGKLGPRR